MRRIDARELLMQLIFQMEAQKDFSEKARQTYIENYMQDSDQLPYFKEALKAFIDNKETIDATIESASKGWHLERMAKVDLAVIRLCVAEMKYMQENPTPQAAAINEAVKMAKKYSGEDSGKFVNGVLGKISRLGNEQ